MIPKFINVMRQAGLLRDLDVYLVEALARAHNTTLDDDGWLLLALTSRALEDGHTCLDLTSLTADWMLRRDTGMDTATLPASINAACAHLADAITQAPDALIARIATITAMATAQPNAKPFIWHAPRLYIRRYWEYEQAVARMLLAMAQAGTGNAPILPETVAQLNQYLDQPAQHQAARMALTRRLTIITGGPGTGKTFTAARILALLTRIRTADGRLLRVRLAAPTGKAAARMDESLRDAMAKVLPATHTTVIEPAATIERLLGFIPGTPYFRHNAGHPLPADVVLIDEASMIDLAKMAKLLDALAPATRLVLLGDMHQLASVQPGSVLAEICESKTMQDCVVRLTQSMRFGQNTPIARLSNAIITPLCHVHHSLTTTDSAGGPSPTPTPPVSAWTILQQTGLPQHAVPNSLINNTGIVGDAFAHSVLSGFRACLVAVTPEQFFGALREFRVLCALRNGPLGAVHVNRVIEDVLALRGVRLAAIPSDFDPARKLHPSDIFYNRRVIMVTQNDHSMRLFNGDVGVILPDPENNGTLTAFFESTGTLAPDATPYRKVACARLPEHETAFAMTIHKAQGSEFGKVMVLMPNRDSPVLARELLYTAITRTAGGLELWCGEKTFNVMVARKTQRASGLCEALQIQNS